MNRPSFQTRVAGHPASVFTIGSLMAFSVYGLTQNIETWPLAAVVGLTMHRVMEANKAVVAFQQWDAAWNAMAPKERPSRPRSRRGMAWVMFALFAAFIAYEGSGEDISRAASTIGPVVLVLTLMALPLLCIRWLWKKRRRVRRASSFVVTVIARRTLPTPNLTNAYSALPPYCHALLRGQQ